MRPYGLRVLRAAFIGLILIVIYFGLWYINVRYITPDALTNTFEIDIFWGVVQISGIIILWGYFATFLTATIFFRASILTRIICGVLFASLTFFVVFVFPGPYFFMVFKTIIQVWGDKAEVWELIRDFMLKTFRAAADMLHHERFDHERREGDLHDYAKRATSMTWHLDDSFEIRRIIEKDWGQSFQGTPDLPITIDDVMTYMDQHKLDLLPTRACERLAPKLTSLQNALSTHQEIESYPLQPS